MKRHDNLEYGSVQVHKRALSEIVCTALNEVNGASLAQTRFNKAFFEAFTDSDHPSIKIKIDDNNTVSIEVRVLVRYGLSIPNIAKEIQQKIRESIDKTVDINLKEINICVQGLERGQNT